jgi:inorganic pyrophosphatase
MPDSNQILTPGDIDNGMVNVIVEIPTGSVNKIEWNPDEESMQLDRVEFESEPMNYGFIPETLGEDGDALDAIVIDEPLATETFKKSRIIGVIEFTDEGVSDDKIIVVPEDAAGEYSKIYKMSDISSDLIDKIKNHLMHSKDYLGHNLTLVEGFGDDKKAKVIINRAIKYFQEKN